MTKSQALVDIAMVVLYLYWVFLLFRAYWIGRP